MRPGRRWTTKSGHAAAARQNKRGERQAAPGYGSITAAVVLVGRSLCTECMATGIAFTRGGGILIDHALV